MPYDLMYQNKFELGTGTDSTTQEPIYSPVAAGVKNVEIANNEGLDQTQYLDGEGFAETDVISAQMTLAFTADRLHGDEAQDFIFGKLTSLGASRRAPFKLTMSNGDMFEGECTIANISPGSGDAGAKQECSFEIHFAGKPTFTAGTGV